MLIFLESIYEVYAETRVIFNI